MPFAPQTLRWPADRALLFVHGVGNAKPGDYAPLVQQVETIMGPAASRYAMYFLYYDQFNEWFSQKQQAEPAFSKLVRSIASLVGQVSVEQSTKLGEVAAQYAGDVIWPVLLADARRAVRDALLAQLQQIRIDGIDAKVPIRRQHVSVIAHSMGCFHVYEALSHAMVTSSEVLSPAADESLFDNIILMASPVQLIRTVADALGALVPQRDAVYSISKPLAVPSDSDIHGQPVPCTTNMVSITGNLDPVGGYLFRHQYAYMDFAGLVKRVDQQQVATVNGSEELSLANLLGSALRNDGPPTITPENPHDWSKYVERNADFLRGCLT